MDENDVVVFFCSTFDLVGFTRNGALPEDEMLRLVSEMVVVSL